MQEFTSISTEALHTVTGAGSGKCDEAPPSYSGAREGAGTIAGAVYTDTGKLPTPAQMQGAERSLTIGRDWNDLCSRVRSERAPGWTP